MTLNSFPLTPTSLSTTTALYYNSNPTIQNAVQTALTHYKQKIMNSTTIEKTYTADQLRHVLLNERHATKSMVAELAAYKSMAVVTQAEAEVVEEDLQQRPAGAGGTNSSDGRKVVPESGEQAATPQNDG